MKGKTSYVHLHKQKTFITYIPIVLKRIHKHIPKMRNMYILFQAECKRVWNGKKAYMRLRESKMIECWL